MEASTGRAGGQRGLLLIAVIAILVVGRHYVESLQERHRLTDFDCYRDASLRLAAGEDLYAGVPEYLAKKSYKTWTKQNVYAYPPALAILIHPLARLEFHTAAWLWQWLVSLAIAGAVVLTLRATRSRPLLPALLPALLIAFATVPVTHSANLGQVDAVLLLLVALSFLAWCRRRDLVCGLLLGLAAAIKPPLAGLGLFLVLRRSWSALAAATASGALLGLLPFALLGGHAFATWRAVSGYFSSAEFAAYPVNQSLRGVLQRLLTGGPLHPSRLELPPAVADAIWIGLAVAAVAWLARLIRPGEREPVQAALQLGLIAAMLLLLGPLTEDIHYTLLVFPIAVLVAELVDPGGGSRRRQLATAAACLYFLQPWLELGYYRQGGILAPFWSGVYVYGLVLVIAVLTMRLRERAVPAAVTPAAGLPAVARAPSRPVTAGPR